MATKLRGMLNLSKIDKRIIEKNQRGESIIWVDILENRNGADQYGNTHTVTLYNKDTRETIYLGNFKPQEFGSGTQAKAAPSGEGDSDLPF